jgi:hypothetical protein
VLVDSAFLVAGVKYDLKKLMMVKTWDDWTEQRSGRCQNKPDLDEQRLHARPKERKVQSFLVVTVSWAESKDQKCMGTLE